MKNLAPAILLSLLFVSCGASDSDTHHHEHDGHAHHHNNEDQHVDQKDSIQESFKIKHDGPVQQ